MKTTLVTGLLSLVFAGVAFAAPFFIVTAPFSHRLSDDPIVFPNQRGASHSHDFVCSTSTNAFSTTQSLESGGTNCGVAADKSGYWVPTLILSSGAPGRLEQALFYYAQSANGIPNGLKMITDRHTWGCWPSNSNSGPNPPASCSEGKFVAVLTFPTWNDGRLDSPDHRSHMSFSRTSTHTRQITQIKGYFRFRLPSATSRFTLSSGSTSTMHADFMEGWSGNSLNELIARCSSGCGRDPS